MKHTIEIFELDTPRCSLEYGVTCSAVLGVTGTDKCYNTPGSCQVPADYTESSEVQVLKFISNSELYSQLGAVPSLLEVKVSPQQIRPGESLGKRERANIDLKDHPHDDYGLDPYINDRTFNPFLRGTYWGKFFARYPNTQGYSCRVYRGEYQPGLTYDELKATLECSNYVVDKFERASGGAEFSVLDALTFTEDKKALCPRPSNGVLSAELSATAVPGNTFTLLPIGIGETYATSGYGSIDKEFFSFTRVGDVFTITGRGLRTSEQKEHEEGATFQQAAEIEGNIAQVLEQLLDFTDTPLSYYDLINWANEAVEHAPEILQAFIAIPTPVETLLNHLIRERMLGIWTDILAGKIRMRALRPVAATLEFSEDNLKSVVPHVENDSRIDTVYFKYGRLNPLEKIDEPKNYAGHLLQLADDPYEAIQNNTSAIHEVNAIFIPSTLRQLAQDMSQLIIARYNRLLRQVKGKTFYEFSAGLGDIVSVSSRFYQDATGAVLQNIPMQVISINRKQGEHELTLREYSFGNYVFSGSRVVSILTNMLNVNLRELYEATYGTGEIPENTNIIFEGDPNGDIVIGSSTTEEWAVEVGEWPEVGTIGVSIDLRYLRIVGAGGQGGGSLFAHPEGYGGGGALYTRVQIAAAECLIGGGGGGGGSSVIYGGSGGSYGPIGTHFGGRGAGHLTGGGATILGGGNASGPLGGDGGNLGQAGNSGQTTANSQGYIGGAAGIAINGVSYVTLIDCDVRGVEIN